MSYLNTHTRTVSPTKNDMFQTTGRQPALFGVFMGYIKDASDVQKNGRLRVWIPEFGSTPDNEKGWIIVNYCSPFAGATNVDSISTTNPQEFTGTQTSYGMWMIPPDVNNIVAVMFLNGDSARGIWIGCLLNQYMNNMIPGMAASTANYQYPGTFVPVAEYNKWDPKVSQPDQSNHPIESTKFNGVGTQGLITDQARGITTSSARRESPSNVFGILTPGPAIDQDIAATHPEQIRRKGGSSFIMDDGTGTEYVQLATKSGAQIKLDESNGFVYVINRDGTGWIEIDYQGNIMVFGAGNISMRAQQDINLRADRNVNIEAGQDIYMKAAKDTNTNTPKPFTYNINNTPLTTNIPFYPYVGQGNGIGGNIVFQALNDLHTTTTKSAYLTVGADLSIQVKNNVELTSTDGTIGIISNTSVTTQTPLIGLVGDTTVQGNLSITGGLIANDSMSIAAGGGIDITSNITMSGTLDLTSPLNTTSNINIGGNVGIYGGLSVHGVTQLNSGTGLSFIANQSRSTYSGSLPTPSVIAPSITPPTITPPVDPTPASPATPAEVKALVEKINILPSFADPTSRFKRNAQALNTTLSTLPTYEPNPEHVQFSFASITGYTPVKTEGQSTYEGSAGAGNDAVVSPATNTDPGANNVVLPPPPPASSALVKDFNINAFECQLKIHEGVKYVSYNDTKNLLTGGIGHLMRANEIPMFSPPGTPITSDQVDIWFQADAPTAIAGAQRLLTTDVWGDLTDIRKRACADLCYNLGEGRLSKFVNFLKNMKTGNYTAAGDSLRSSAWFTQVGRRGPNIITMIVQNVDPNGCDVKFPA